MDKIEDLDLDFLFPVNKDEGSGTLSRDLGAEYDEVEEEIFEENAGLPFAVDLETRILCSKVMLHSLHFKARVCV